MYVSNYNYKIIIVKFKGLLTNIPTIIALGRTLDYMQSALDVSTPSGWIICLVTIQGIIIFIYFLSVC